jgi:hypothetical protein
MKKKVFYLLCLVGIACSINSCDALSNNCKNCKIVYYNGTVRDHEDSASQYCGADLVAIQATPNTTIGSLTAKWECN